MENTVCVECHQAITNPICPSCLKTEMAAWAYDRNESLGDFIDSIDREQLLSEGIECILCGERMNTCPHCTTKEMSIELFNRAPLQVRDFIETFDFEILGR